MKPKMKAFIEFMLVDSYSKKTSHTKFWSNIGHAIFCALFCYAVIAGSASTELWIVFGAFILGNRTASKLLNFKYGNRQSTDGEEDGRPTK